MKRVDIASIGTAVPADAARVALGLGVSVPATISAFYRAPAALIQGLPESAASAIAELLGSLGCEVEVVAADAPLPQLVRLLDVAVHVADERQLDRVAAAAAEFLGCSQADSRRRLLATPPVLLGSVSPATADALRRRLGEGVTVLTSDPSLATYDLLLGECPAVQRARLVADLQRHGFTPTDAGPWLLRDLSKEQADRVWAAQRRTPGLQIVNQDFYLFDVVLDAGTSSPEAAEALAEAGIPPDVVALVFGAMPVVVADTLTKQDAVALIANLSQAGLEAHADLVTFLQSGVRVTGCTSPDALRAALVEVAGVQNPPQAPPFVLGPWPELTARLVRDLLVRLGASAELVDAETIEAGGWSR